MQSIEYQVEKLRKQKKISQALIAANLGFTQSAYSQRINGKVKFKADEIKKLAELLDVPVAELYDQQVVSDTEPVMYRTSATTKEAMRARFNEGLDEYKIKNKIDTWTDVSEKLKLPVNHMNAVRGGHKDVTIALLANCSKHGNINANYVLCGKVPVLSDSYHSHSEVEGYKRRIEELEKDKSVLQMLVDSLGGQYRQTA